MAKDSQYKKKRYHYLLISLCIAVVAILGFNSLGIRNVVGTNSEIKALAASGNISIVKASTELKRGDIGFITIKGDGGVRYTVTTSFVTGNITRRVTQWRVTDGNGLATFLWNVGYDTVVGTYPLSISGGGEVLNLYHTVTQ